MIDTNYANALVNAAAGYLGVAPELVTSTTATKTASLARHAVSYVLRKDGFYLIEIGRFFVRNHTSIWHGVEKIDHLLQCGDPDTKRLVAHIRESVIPAPLPVTSTSEAEIVMRALIRVGGDIQVLAAALQEMAAKVTRQAELSIEEIRLREVA